MRHEVAPQPRSRTTITDEVRKQSISRLIPPDVRAQLLRSNLRARENQHSIKRDLWRNKVTIFEETARRQRKVMSGEASNSSNAAIARRRTSVLMRRLKARKMIDADRPPPPPLYQPVLGREAIERCIEAGSVYMKRLLALWDPKSRSRARSPSHTLLSDAEQLIDQLTLAATLCRMMMGISWQALSRQLKIWDVLRLT